MKRVSWVMAIVLGAVACSPAPAPAPESAASPTVPTRPHATVAQLMRATPFPASNIIFDTQTVDPAAPKTASPGSGPGGSGGATGTFSSLYGGWEAVENSALELAETANLLAIPGRMCENGRPAPLDREDYRTFIQGLADAGNEAYRVAKTRNLEAMAEVSNTVADACAACHEVYRDKEDLKDRCIP